MLDDNQMFSNLLANHVKSLSCTHLNCKEISSLCTIDNAKKIEIRSPYPGGKMVTKKLGALLGDIISDKAGFNSSEFSFVGREANQVTHILIREVS